MEMLSLGSMPSHLHSPLHTSLVELVQGRTIEELVDYMITKGDIKDVEVIQVYVHIIFKF